MKIISIDINIDSWINYNKAVGVEGLHITGLPGTGKSNMANLLAWYCLQKGEHLLLPGDRFCEWRHFLDYPSTCRVKVIVPSSEMVELKYHPEKIEDYKIFIKLDSYENIVEEVNKVLKEDTPTVLAIYDACFKPADRAALWVILVENLINRFYHIDKAIGILFHESGNYWPEMARSNHWKAVDDFCSLFVDCRKGLVRPIIISQLDAEVETRIRGKCMVKVHRKGWGSRKLPTPLKESIPFTAINEYQYQYGGLYVRYNTIDLFKEKKIIYKIIPCRYIDGVSLPNGDSKKKLNPTENVLKKAFDYILLTSGLTKTELCKQMRISPTTLRKYE